MKLRIAILYTLYIIALLPAWAQERPTVGGGDSLQISLLTCSPGPEVYALYGHTAIRVVNQHAGTDLVYNYGSFNMQEPYFILKFMLGWLDYELGLSTFRQFWGHYSYDGCDITQQELNLTPAEKVRMLQLLTQNYKPENRGYRYNFLYDNCSTRPRDIIESVVDGQLVWPEGQESSSYRDLMHECNLRWPWSRLGVDLVLGQEADQQITLREQEYLPVYLLNHLDGAQIQGADGTVRPAVLQKTVFPASIAMDDSKEFFLTPMQCVVLLLVLALLLGGLEYRRHQLYWGVDVILLLAQGIAGVLVFILFFFSDHPTVGSNWLLWVFNPIPLVYLPFMICRRVKHQKEPFQAFLVGGLLLFVCVSPLIPQSLPLEAVWAALVLSVRAGSHLLYDYLPKLEKGHDKR